MTKLFTTLAVLMLSLGAFAQGNLVFFTEGGETFTVILNGQRYNDQATTNVKVTDLAQQAYQCKIIFSDASLGTIDKKVYAENYAEATYKIKRKAESKTSMSFKRVANHVSKDLKRELDNDTVNTAQKEDWYVMRLMAKTALPMPAAQVNQARAANYTTNVDASTQTTRQTTHVTTAAPEGVNMSMNVSVDGSNASMDVRASDPGYHGSTTTTTTTTEHYVMPGYTGNIGCPWPMSEQDFGSAANSVRSKSFDSSKLAIAKQIAGSNCMFASQVRDLMMTFDFEKSKLEFAKFAYSNTYDINNYYKVNDAFDFESSIQELNRSIGQ